MLPILRLIRFSNAPTVVGDILAGFLLASAGAFDWLPWPLVIALCLIACSACLYSWGMALNDLNDYEQDRRNGSQRPLVTGDVSHRFANGLAAGLLGLGILFLITACILDRQAMLHSEGIGNRIMGCWLVFAILVGCIWLYDGPAKQTPLAPFVMGCCRGANLLLGATLPVSPEATSVFQLPADVWICVAAMVLYISGVTWIARKEEAGGHRRLLLLGTILILAGYGLLAFGLPWWGGELGFRSIGMLQERSEASQLASWLWPLSVLLIGFPVLRRASVALLHPTPGTIKLAVIAALGNLVFIDGLICLYAAPEMWWTALLVAGMIIPITFLKRTIPPT